MLERSTIVLPSDIGTFKENKEYHEFCICLIVIVVLLRQDFKENKVQY